VQTVPLPAAAAPASRPGPPAGQLPPSCIATSSGAAAADDENRQGGLAHCPWCRGRDTARSGALQCHWQCQPQAACQCRRPPAAAAGCQCAATRTSASRTGEPARAAAAAAGTSKSRHGRGTVLTAPRCAHSARLGLQMDCGEGGLPKKTIGNGDEEAKDGGDKKRMVAIMSYLPCR
jgi:hypothetical protein